MGILIDKRMKGKANTNGLANNPENINKNGRPKKTVSVINIELKEKGFPPVSMQDIKDAYLQIMNLDDEALDELKDGSSKMPLLYKIILKHLGKDKGYDVMEKMLDRAIGKAIQHVEQKNINYNKDMSEYSDSEIDKLINGE